MNLPKADTTPQIILVIDDDVQFRTLLTHMLGRVNYHVEVAADGETGIELAGKLQPDLILCDIMMPDMDGAEVFRRLHGSSKTATIPFVFLTALAGRDDILAGMRLGADDYVTKPIKQQDLLQTVQTRLDRRAQVQVEQLRSFTSRLVQSREMERRRLALMLQNDIQNTLLSLKYSLELLDDSQHTGVKRDAENAIASLIDQVDALTTDLHPTIMDHLGLVPALRWLMTQYEIKISLVANNLDFEFDTNIKNTLFRIVQHALNNVEQHAGIETAFVEVRYDGKELEAIVTDTGIGFDLEEKLASPDTNGLLNMYELTAALGGELTISSTANTDGGRYETGTVVYAKLPVVENNTTALISDPKRTMRQVLNDAYSRTPSEKRRKKITIAIAIEQDFLRHGMHRLLRQNQNYNVVKILDNLEAVEPFVKSNTPDLLIINPISLQTNHFDTELIQHIVQANTSVRVLVAASSIDSFYVANAISAGAHGYTPNGTTLSDLYTAINNIADGDIYISPTIQLEDIEAGTK